MLLYILRPAHARQNKHPSHPSFPCPMLPTRIWISRSNHMLLLARTDPFVRKVSSFLFFPCITREEEHFLLPAHTWKSQYGCSWVNIAYISVHPCSSTSPAIAALNSQIPPFEIPYNSRLTTCSALPRQSLPSSFFIVYFRACVYFVCVACMRVWFEMSTLPCSGIASVSRCAPHYTRGK